MSTLSNGHKRKLRKSIIAGARNYEKYLCGKTFKIICDDGFATTVCFVKTDFKHMTGLKSNLNDSDFFRNCVLGTIDKGNINSNQRYNWGTLKKKAEGIKTIHHIIYLNGVKTLLLDTMRTHTETFPIGVLNDTADLCVGFVSSIHRGRSLRVRSTTINSRESKSINAIFAKHSGDSKYSELVCISDVKKLLSSPPTLLDDIDNRLLDSMKRK